MDHQDFLKQFGTITEKLNEQSKRVDKSWWGIAESVRKVSEHIETGWPAAISKFYGKQDALIKGFSKVSDFLKDPMVYQDAVANKWKLRQESMRLATKLASAGLTKDEQERLKAINAEKSVLTDVIAQNRTLGKLHLERMVFLPALVGSFKATAKFAEDQQKALIGANLTLKERIRLMGDIAFTQRATGASAETLAEASQAAVNHGLDLRDTYGRDLTLITKMKEGMGVSAEASAELVASMRLMGGNASAVADSIATLKANTALAADEATRLAKQLTMAMAVMAPGGDVSKIIKVVGGLEGAAKQLGMGSGKIMGMMEGWTKQSGLMGVGMLGLQPDFLKDQATSMEAFSRMVEFTETQLKSAGNNAYARQAVLEQYAEIFGTTTDVIANGRKVLDEYNKTKGKATTVDEQWRQQTNSFAKSWDKLKNQLGGLIHGALLPLVGVLQTVVEWMSRFVTWITASKTALYSTVGVLTAFSGHTAWKMFGMLKNFGPVASAIGRMAPWMGRVGLFFGKIGALLPGIAGAGSVLTGLLAVLGIGAAGAAGWGLGRVIGKLGGIDEKMQKIFGVMMGTTKSGIATGKLNITDPKTAIEVITEVANKRARGEGEKDVHDWVMAAIDKIQWVGDPAMVARQKAALLGRYEKEGYEQQRMLEIQATTMTADKTCEATQESTRILKELLELELLKKKIYALTAEEQKTNNEAIRRIKEIAAVEASMQRQKINIPIIRQATR